MNVVFDFKYLNSISCHCNFELFCFIGGACERMTKYVISQSISKHKVSKPSSPLKTTLL